MPRIAGTKEVTKNALLETGIQIMLEKGYTNTGIVEVLETTGIPKGSFYYYFDSKEDYGVQIIHYFDRNYSEHLRQFLENLSLSPLERIRSYCEQGIRSLENNQCRKGCLIGNLSQEMSDQSEIMRAHLEEVMNRWRNRFAQCIKEGQDAHEISSRIDHVKLAEFFQSAWHGAILRAKTTKTTEPLIAFMEVMFDQLLKP